MAGTPISSTPIQIRLGALLGGAQYRFCRVSTRHDNVLSPQIMENKPQIKSEAIVHCVEHLPEAPNRDEKHVDISSNNAGCNGTHISINIPLLGCLFGRQR